MGTYPLRGHPRSRERSIDDAQLVNVAAPREQADPLSSTSMSEQIFGAMPVRGGVRFRVWAPTASRLTLVLQDGRARGDHPMPRDSEGLFDALVDGAHAGDRYGYRVDGGEVRPDPASRFQPSGVHGLSQVIDPGAFTWTDDRWRNRPAGDRILYEVHIGTFTPEGTFTAAATKLDTLRDTGVTVIEIMPVADFPGSRNWGYDGVCLFAPSRAYGHPDDLRRLVDRAHTLGLAVVFDVVYNHLGPEGAYLTEFNRSTSPIDTSHRGDRESTSMAHPLQWFAALSSKTRCTGYASITPTGYGSTPRMR